MRKDLLYEVPNFLLQSVRDVVSERENKIAHKETRISIEKATLAMCEAKYRTI